MGKLVLGTRCFVLLVQRSSRDRPVIDVRNRADLTQEEADRKMGSQGARLLLLHDRCLMQNAMSKYGAG